jgi:hypothetical protein
MIERMTACFSGGDRPLRLFGALGLDERADFGIVARVVQREPAPARDRALPALVAFDYNGHDGKVTILKPLLGQTGWLSLSLFTVESLDHTEDHLLFAAATTRRRAAS